MPQSFSSQGNQQQAGTQFNTSGASYAQSQQPPINNGGMQPLSSQSNQQAGPQFNNYFGSPYTPPPQQPVASGGSHTQRSSLESNTCNTSYQQQQQQIANNSSYDRHDSTQISNASNSNNTNINIWKIGGAVATGAALDTVGMAAYDHFNEKDEYKDKQGYVLDGSSDEDTDPKASDQIECNGGDSRQGYESEEEDGKEQDRALHEPHGGDSDSDACDASDQREIDDEYLHQEYLHQGYEIEQREQEEEQINTFGGPYVGNSEPEAFDHGESDTNSMYQSRYNEESDGEQNAFGQAGLSDEDNDPESEKGEDDEASLYHNDEENVGYEDYGDFVPQEEADEEEPEEVLDSDNEYHISDNGLEDGGEE